MHSALPSPWVRVPGLAPGLSPGSPLCQPHWLGAGRWCPQQAPRVCSSQEGSGLLETGEAAPTDISLPEHREIIQWTADSQCSPAASSLPSRVILHCSSRVPGKAQTTQGVLGPRSCQVSWQRREAGSCASFTLLNPPLTPLAAVVVPTVDQRPSPTLKRNDV